MANSPALSLNGHPWPPSDAQLMLALKSARVSSPAKDPAEVYPDVPGLPDANTQFRLGSAALSPDVRDKALRVAREYLSLQQSRFMGFPCNQKLAFAEDMSGYLNVHINNTGDPFTTGSFTLNSKFMERAVLDYYASLWNARWPSDSADPESYWGFVLSMGSSEGNLYGMWNARDYLSGKVLLSDPSAVEEDRQASLRGTPRRAKPRLVKHQAIRSEENPNAYTPVVFYAEDTHSSLAKASSILGMRTFYDLGLELFVDDCPLEGWKGKGWPQEVPSQNDSTDSDVIDINSLGQLVEFFAKRGYPIIACFNFGSNLRGTYDNVEAAGEVLLPIFRKYGLDERKVYYDPDHPEIFHVRTGYWFHVDGAVGAAHMPFIEMAFNSGILDKKGPAFDFRLPFVHSIAMSGHKSTGVPVPCGVYMTRTKYQMLPPNIPEYIGTPDTSSGPGTTSGPKPTGFPMPSDVYMTRTKHQMHPPETPVYIGTPDTTFAHHTAFGFKSTGFPMPSDVFMTRTKFEMRPPETPEYIGTPDTTFAQHTTFGPKSTEMPLPTGVYMTKTKYQMVPSENSKYIATPATTFVGSRNGLSPMLLWDHISRHSFLDQIKKALYIEAMAQHTEHQLQKLQEILKTDLWVARTPLALTVMFKQANQDISFKYSLSSETLWVNGVERKYSHAFMMEHVTMEMVDDLTNDLSKEGAFLEQEHVEATKVTLPALHIN